jgi:DNA helicase-2/ATP-dependent DNA helicase PcrA
MSASRVSPNQIFRAIQKKEKLEKNPDMQLTSYQEAAVLASRTQPVLVVAGAGSGKTELMAIRVLWLVANEFAKPQDILGLTFTRKAASELAKRINNGLLALEKTDLWPQELRTNGYSLPVISTYNSYANGIFRDNAMLLGYEPESQLLSEGSAFQLAKTVVLREGNNMGVDFQDADFSLKSAIDVVLKLSAELNDNVQSGASVKATIESLREKLLAVTKEGELNKTNSDYFAGALNTAAIVDLAEAYRREKLHQGYVDYSDQVKLAEEVVSQNPAVGVRERELHKFVLLDEYQDTSFLQTRLLRELYRDHPVFAVGDPNQSIYGWRGASATNLNEYLELFSTKPDFPVVQMELPTSWRNPKVVLDAANIIAAPLGRLAVYQQQRGLKTTDVSPLEPMPNAQDGHIDILWLEHIADEAKQVAAWMAQRMATPFNPDEGEEAPTGAILMRKKAAMELFVSELEAAGLDVEVVGLGGLLEMPEILDLVSALKVVHSPNSGAALVRLLAGPRWRIGPKDISRLHRWARSIGRMSDSDLKAKAEDGLGAEYESSLVDALDLLADEKKDSLYGMSDSSLARLVDAGQTMRKLRQQTGLPLSEFVQYVSRELHLDIELAANPRRVNPFSNLNSFFTIVSNYESGSNVYLGSFLEWLDFASGREKIEVASTSTKAGVVQVLTVHSAKGLEWDYVAVPNMTDRDFPNEAKSKKGWLSVGALPFPLRGDVRSLPELDLSGATKEADLKKVREDFSENNGIHLEREERRLAYVAITRPKAELLLSGSRWKVGSKDVTKPQNLRFLGKPSPYLLEIANSGLSNVRILQAADDGSIPEFDSLVNPQPASLITEQWPMDPLGERHRVKLEAAALEVSDQIDNFDEDKSLDDDTAQVVSEVQALIDDLALSEVRAKQVKLPVRIPASKFKDFLKKPKEIAENYRRPMPSQPFAETMKGTLFHSWIESRYGLVANADQIDDSQAALEELELITPQDLAQLKENFEKSRWAKLEAKEIEVEIQVTFGQNTFICKIDAVFDVDPNDRELLGKKIEIVDWKTGKPPANEIEEDERALQLGLYRMAYAQHFGVAEQDIAVCLYYVADDLVVRPKNVLTGDQLRERWDAILQTFKPEGSESS